MMYGAEIQCSLTTKFVGRAIRAFDAVDSTNTVARRIAEEGAPEGTVIIAEKQTAGRGRLNRSWYGEAGKGILLSLVMRPDSQELARIATYIAAIGAAKAAEKYTGLAVECKWPNDLLLGGKKFCGILLESSWRDSHPNYLIVGIGMNVNEESFPKALQSKATSLRLETGKEIDRAGLLSGLLEEFEREYLKAKDGGVEHVLDEWEKRCPMLGKPITVNQSGHAVRGKAIRLGVDGALILQHRNREIRIYTGDTTVVG